MSSTSLIYRDARLYALIMRALYGRHYAARMRAVADQVPNGASVVELCCGPGTLYERYLKGRVSSYVGLDVNERFTSALRDRGVDARTTDLAAPGADPLPPADLLIIQASLYHFINDDGASAILDRMLAAARDSVVVAEPVRNLASSRLPLLGAVGRKAADPGTGDHAQRFSEATLDALMERHRDLVLRAFLIPGGREKVYVLRSPAARRSGTGAGS